MFLGQAEEIVYPHPPPDFKAKMLSQLLWDIKPVFYDSMSLDFSQAQPMEKWGLFATLSLKIGFPGKSGEMEDRDWESVENDALTKYSVHDNVTKELFIFDAFAGVSLPLNEMLLKAYVTMSYMRFSFSGMDGHKIYAQSLGNGKYAPINDNPETEQFSGKVINYTQTWLTIAPGISVGSYFDRFYFEFFFTISPLVSCRGVDEHLERNIVFKDYMRGGVFIEPGLHFSFIASRQLEFSLDLSWRYIGGTRGETWTGSPIDTTALVQNGKAGARLSLFNFGLCMKMRLAAEEKEAGLNR
jgi:outer membrane protease